MRAMRTRHHRSVISERRRGAVLVLAAAFLVVIFGFLAFTLDSGYIALTRTQAQAAADSAALGAALELPDGLGDNPALADWEVEAEGRTAAVELAALHKGGDRDSIYADGERDVQFGQYGWNPQTDSWDESWGTAPYNIVQVTLRRGITEPGIHGEPGGADGPLPLFFAPVIGHRTANLSVRAAAALIPGTAFRIPPGSPQHAMVLPITLDLPSWEDLMNDGGPDDFGYNPSTQLVFSGTDDILEIDIYPEAAPDGNGNGNGNGQNQWTPGNRGTVDFGSSNNSTADLCRQIRYGLNTDDLSYFGGQLSFDNGPIEVNGDPGISAGIQSALDDIIGQTRAIPLFTTVTGEGNNTTYTIVQFVAVRIMNVELHGGNKHLIVQPGTLVDSTVVPGQTPITDATIFTAPRLIH